MNKVVMLINNFSWHGKRPFHTWLPAVPIITALLKDRFDFQVLDANVNNWSIEQTEKKLAETGAELVLISALSIDYQKQYHTLALVAKQALPNCITLMGGIYPTTLPYQVLEDPNIDVIMQGHAEERLPGIVEILLSGCLEMLEHEPGIGLHLHGKATLTPLTSMLYQTKHIVKPDYSCLEIEKYFQFQKEYNPKNYSTECAEKRSVNIISSYGCPYNCFFCANRSLSGSHVVYRPVEDVIDEIAYFVKNFQVEQISFMDDNIVADKIRAKRLFSELIARKYDLEIQIGNLAAWDLDDELLDLLHEAGCTRIGISVESGVQRVLAEIMHKPLRLEIIPPLIRKFRERNIMMIADFIIGLPGETWEEIRKSLEYAYGMEADLCNINIAVPYPGTDMYVHMKQHGQLPEDFRFNERFFIDGLLSCDEFSAAELQVLRAFEWERINTSTPERRIRAMRALRLTENELDAYCRDMRAGALRFVKKYS